MTLLLKIRTLFGTEDGAVSIDWVVLTAAIVAVGVAVGSTLNPTASPIAQSINTSMEATETSMTLNP